MIWYVKFPTGLIDVGYGNTAQEATSYALKAACLPYNSECGNQATESYYGLCIPLDHSLKS